jgi:thiamine biosynthesis protein ThiS
MQRNINIILNGKERCVAGSTTLKALVDSLGLDRSAIVIEKNETVIDKKALDTIELSNGDVIEVLQFVGGG